MKNRLNYVEEPEKVVRFHKTKYKPQSIFLALVMAVLFMSSFSYKVQADGSTLDEARSIIENNYVTPVPDSVLYQPTIEDIIKGLNDPYSEYFTAAQEQDFINSINNTLYGIGIYMDIVPEGVKVDQVVDNSPAQAVGMQPGDIIISANGNSLAGLTADQASQYIKGAAGTSDTAQLFAEKLQELRMKNPDNYIVDLRDNGGGYMSTAVNIAGNFIGQNTAVIVEDKNGVKTGYYADNTGATIDKPIIFLVNQYTASASEILSAAVKDYGKAYFIGTTTYGKGVAQEIFPLSDGSALKLTVEKFYSPKGNVIQKVGITPDFQVPDNIDSLAVADLFSGQSGNVMDKTGYVKVNVGGKDFEINLNTAKDENHWAAFRYILSKVPQNNVYIGTKDGWVNAPADYFTNIYKFFYGNYKVFNTIDNVPQDKAFTITFNKQVDPTTIGDETNMEIINSQTGQRAAFDIKKVDNERITLVPQENLQSGETYYIKVKNDIIPFVVKN
jgi:carboxyl-terminal processing protease